MFFISLKLQILVVGPQLVFLLTCSSFLNLAIRAIESNFAPNFFHISHYHLNATGS